MRSQFCINCSVFSTKDSRSHLAVCLHNINRQVVLNFAENHLRSLTLRSSSIFVRLSLSLSLQLMLPCGLRASVNLSMSDDAILVDPKHDLDLHMYPDPPNCTRYQTREGLTRLSRREVLCPLQLSHTKVEGLVTVREWQIHLHFQLGILRMLNLKL